MNLNSIHCGDSLEWLQQLPDKCCDIFMDPPYNVGKDYVVSKDNLSDDQYQAYLTEVLNECKRVGINVTIYIPKKHNLWMWSALGPEFREVILTNFLTNAFYYGFVNHYNKLLTNFKPDRKSQIKNVWDRIAMPGTGYFFKENTYGHPGYTSEAITFKAVKELCENPVICDPFMGTGTTAVAAVSCGHNYIGCDLNPGYIEIAEKRIQILKSKPTLFDVNSI